MGWIEISVLIVALAFAVLVVYVIRTLQLTQKAVKQVTEQMVQLQARIEQVSEESVRLIQKTNRIAEELHEKLKAFDHMCSAVEDVGHSIKQVSGSIRQISASLSQTVTQQIEKTAIQADDRFREILKWTMYTYELLMRWRSARLKPNHFEGGKENG